MKKIVSMLLMIVLICSMAVPTTAKASTDEVYTVPTVATQSDIDSLKESSKLIGFCLSSEATTAGLKVNLKKGCLFTLLNECNDIVKTEHYYISVELYTDESCTTLIGNSDAYNEFMAIPVPEDGEYYVQYSLNIFANREVEELTFCDLLCQVSGSDRWMKDQEIIYAYSDVDAKEIYYKVKVSKASTIVFSYYSDRMATKGYTDVGMTLCDSKKKELTNGVYKHFDDGIEEEDTATIFSVAKGTYYIKVETGDGFYTITPSIKNAKNSGASTRKKAANIKVGSTASGTLLVKGGKKWYKFTLKKDSKVEFETAVFATDMIRVNLYQGNSTSACYSEYSHTGKLSIVGGELDKKLPKGTYYIAIDPMAKDVSGYYTVSVKTVK